jgi:predicted Zn-dependent protease
LIETVGDMGAGLLNDVTDSALPELSEETRQELGKEHLDEVLEKHPRTSQQNAVNRVNRLFAEMAQGGDFPHRRFTVTIVEDETVNAYSFIGHNIVMTTGFLDFAGSDDDMVFFVMAHEVGHVQLGHTELPFRRAKAAGTLGPAGTLAHGAAEQVLRVSPMSQAQERDADCYAVRLLRKASRPVDGAVRFFNRMDEKERKAGTREPDDELVGALFGSHPQSSRRIDNIRDGCK